MDMPACPPGSLPAGIKKELSLYLWEHACRLYREKVRKGDTQTTDLFEILCQRVLAGCVFMREAPTIYLFILREFFEENREIREELQNHYKIAYLHGTEDIRGPADMDLFRPGVAQQTKVPISRTKTSN